MSNDPSDSTYDFVPVPRKFPRGTPPPIPQPKPLQYRRIEPAAAAPVPPPEQPKQVHKLSSSEWLFYLLRMLGCVGLIGLGVLWLVFIDHRSLAGMVIGFFMIGIGFSLFLFAGPSSAEKRGYHF
jgi:hypothetical protein